jgi:putative ABC transport system permease protein
MRPIKLAGRVLRALFRRERVEAEMDDEFRFHLEMETEQNLRAGLSPAEARRRALVAFGAVERVREECRDARGTRGVEEGAKELRLAARRLLRQPGFTLPVLLTLALGTGAATAVFTLLDAVVLRPLPYPAAERLVRLASPVPGVEPGARWGVAKGQFLHFQRQAHSFEALGLYTAAPVVLAAEGPGRPAERAGAARVSGGVLDVLGVRPRLGRRITVEDGLTEEPAVALLGHDLWVRRFGADPGVVGRTMPVEGAPVRIVGVLPPDARLPEELELPDLARIDLWLPLWLDPAQPARNNHVFRAVGRLRPGVTPAAAQSELARLTAALPAVLPEAYSPEFMRSTGFSTEAVPLREGVVGGAGRVLWVLFAAVGLLLLVACANAAGLFLARLQARRREMAVRAALGAGRRELARHFLAETVPLALAAGALALLMAHGAVRLLVALSPAGIPRLDEVRVGWTAILFTLGVSLAAGTAFGLLPLLRREGDVALLREAGRGMAGSRRQHGARAALVVAQVALSLVLLAGAALLFQSFRRLSAVHPGFDPRGVLTFRVSLPAARAESFEAADAFHRALVARLEAVPGVEAAGVGSALPLSGYDGCTAVIVEGPAQACVPVHTAAPGWLRALGVPVRGREGAWGEGRVAVVSRAFAERTWPGRDPVGRTLYVGGIDTAPYRVVGVAGDVRGAGLDRPATEDVHLPLHPPSPALGSAPPPSVAVALRARAGRPERLEAAVRRAVAEVDPQAPVADVRPLSALVSTSMARTSFAALLLGAASLLALALSAVGMYGVVAYLVAQRRAEIGIRMALGAPARRVAREVVAGSLRLAALGVVLGLAGAVAATRALRSLLFGVSPADPWVLALASAFLAAVAALASWAPARRAMRVDPAEALRHE